MNVLSVNIAVTRCRRVIIPLFVAVLASCQSGTSPDSAVYLNSSFEHATPQGHPIGWYIEADSGSVNLNVDGTQVREGQNALHVQVQSGEAYIYTPLWKDECLARTDAKARVRVASPDVRVSLFYLVPGTAPLMGDASDSASTAEWQTMGISRTAAEKCVEDELLFGIHVSGDGEAWIDAVEFDVSPPFVSFTGTPPRAHGERDIDDIREHAFAIPSPTAIRGETRRKIARQFEGARLVGLGENSHGAAALFELKHGLVQVLVEDLGYNIFALEMPADPADFVNDYIQNRSDDVDRALLALSYPAWQSAEMLTVIEWLREHNRQADNKVTFLGLDTPSEGNSSDDQRMAARAIEILDGAGDGARMILWADNTHVTKAGNAMGGLLSKQFGADYVAVGLTFNEGYYSANGPDVRYAAHEPWPGTHEHILAEAGPDAFLLDLAALPRAHALLDRRSFRYIGSRPQAFNQFYPHQLEEHFDVVGFVRETGSTEYLLEHEF